MRDLVRLENLGPTMYTGDVRVFVRFPVTSTNTAFDADADTHDPSPSPPSSASSSSSTLSLGLLSASPPGGLPAPHVSCNGRVWRTTEFRANSAQLLRTGSAVFAEQLLSPERQARIRRRLGLPPLADAGARSTTETETETGTEAEADTKTDETKAESSSPRQLKELVLDLTPPAEGDELVAQMSALSVPRDITGWWTSMERLGTPRWLVSGHDDHCPRHADVNLHCPRRPDYVAGAENRGRDELLDLTDVGPAPARAIPDYCPTRHRVNILRLLLAIRGEELVLDSAPRVFTLVAIAEILGCTSVLVSGLPAATRLLHGITT